MKTPKVGLNKIVRKEGYVWQINYQLNGKRIREVVGNNKKEAQLYAAKIQTDIFQNKLGIKKKKNITFKKLSSDYLQLKTNLSESSLTRYKGFIENFEHFFSKYFPIVLEDISQISSNYIATSIDYFTTKGAKSGTIWSSASANSYKTFLASLFKYAIGEKYINENPASKIPNKKIEKKVFPKFYSIEEVNKILEKAPKFWSDFYCFLLNTGLRIGEALNLDWKNVELLKEKPKFTVKSTGDWTVKTYEQRTILLNKTAQNILELIEVKEGYVFQEYKMQIPRNKPLRELKKILKIIGIDGDIHKFRHTFASNHYMINKSIVDLQKILGHKDVETTMVYTHLSNQHIYDGMLKMDIKK